VQEIEGLVRKGGVRADDVFALLHRAIDGLPAEDRRALRPEAEGARRRGVTPPPARPAATVSRDRGRPRAAS
jgi:hypothetical protein